MKKYIETLHVDDCSLAYAIMNALENDGYSVEYREARSDRRDASSFEIRVCREEKLIHTNIGFTAIQDNTEGAAEA